MLDWQFGRVGAFVWSKKTRYYALEYPLVRTDK